MDINRLPPQGTGNYGRSGRTERSRENAAGDSVRDASASESRTASAGQSDGVSLSDGVRELQRVGRHVQSLPDVREERVTELRTQISNGSYQVSDESLATSLLQFTGI